MVRRTGRGSAWAVAVALCLGGCASRPLISAVAPSNCFALALGTWNGSRYEPWYRVPPVIRFDSLSPVAGTSRDTSAWELRPLMFKGPRVHATWRRLQGDSIAFGWGNGFVYLGVRGQIRGDSLKGQAEAFSDFIVEGAPNSKAFLSGVRRPCPATFDTIVAVGTRAGM